MPRIDLCRLTKVYPAGVTDAGLSILRVMLGRRTRAVRAQGHAALDSVSLTIQAGERVGIIGANGAGKSTLLHMIAGIGTPTAGSVTVDGRVTSILTLGIGLRDEVTGRENIYL